MIVTKAGYQIRRSLTQWDYEIITLEVSQQLEADKPTDGTEMLSYCKELVSQFYSPVQSGQVPEVKQVPAQAAYQPVAAAQRAPSAAPRAYQPRGGQGGQRAPRASNGIYSYKLPYPTDENWKAMCKQSGGGFDGIAKLWKSNTLLPGAESFLVGGPPQGQQTDADQDDLPF